jgi:hypothetical protein
VASPEAPQERRETGFSRQRHAHGHKDLSPEAPEGRREMWYVYFLELTNGDIYVGSTSDLRRRVASHQQGHHFDLQISARRPPILCGGRNRAARPSIGTVFQVRLR